MIKTEDRGSTNSTRTTNGGSYNNMEGGPGGPTSDSGGGGGPGGPDGVLTCCLVENGRPCTRLAGNACYSKKIQKTVAQKKLKLYMNDNARHIYICDYHKDMIQSLRSKRKRPHKGAPGHDGTGNNGSDLDDGDESDNETLHGQHPEVDLFQLQLNTLRRYKKHFKVHVRQGLNKAQLADSMTRHFKTLPVPEKETVTYFIYMVKTKNSKLDRDHDP